MFHFTLLHTCVCFWGQKNTGGGDVCAGWIGGRVGFYATNKVLGLCQQPKSSWSIYYSVIRENKPCCKSYTSRRQIFRACQPEEEAVISLCGEREGKKSGGVAGGLNIFLVKMKHPDFGACLFTDFWISNLRINHICSSAWANVRSYPCLSVCFFLEGNAADI